jgi:hypothetical protein
MPDNPVAGQLELRFCYMRLAGSFFKKAMQIESFGYGFAFAFGMALVRFLFAMATS